MDQFYLMNNYIIPIFLLFIFMAIIISLASAKKQNIGLWLLLSFFGYVFILIFSRSIYNNLIFRLDLFLPVKMGRYMFYSIITKLIAFSPIIYELILIFILSLTPTKSSSRPYVNQNQLQCPHCGTRVQPNMNFCPFCGNQL